MPNQKVQQIPVNSVCILKGQPIYLKNSIEVTICQVKTHVKGQHIKCKN